MSASSSQALRLRQDHPTGFLGPPACGLLGFLTFMIMRATFYNNSPHISIHVYIHVYISVSMSISISPLGSVLLKNTDWYEYGTHQKLPFMHLLLLSPLSPQPAKHKIRESGILAALLPTTVFPVLFSVIQQPSNILFEWMNNARLRGIEKVAWITNTENYSSV